MYKNAIRPILLLGILGAGLYFARPHWKNYAQRRQVEAECLMIVHAMAGEDAKLSPYSSIADAQLHPGQLWYTLATPAKNNLRLQLLRTGDANSISIGKLRFKKLAEGGYWAQSEAATYSMKIRDDSGSPHLFITTGFISEPVSSMAEWGTSSANLDTEPYKTLLQQEHRGK